MTCQCHQDHQQRRVVTLNGGNNPVESYTLIDIQKLDIRVGVLFQLFDIVVVVVVIKAIDNISSNDIDNIQ
ncbi:hypothetical protein BGX21_007868, partial [Mortierella sp. AD011]